MLRKSLGHLLRAAGKPVLWRYRSSWCVEPRPLLPLRQVVTAKFLLQRIFRYGHGLQAVTGNPPREIRPPTDHPLASLWQLEPPVFSGWALPEETVLWLWQFLQERKPRVIWEFGSGVSTLAFATYARLQTEAGRQVRVFSFEHEAEWATATRERLEVLGLGDCACVIDAPLVNQELPQGPGLCYDLGCLTALCVADEATPDLCLIDGPPDEKGRGATLPVAAQYFGEQTTVLLDDAFRDTELDCCHAWEKLKNVNVVCKGILPFRHGVALFEVTKPSLVFGHSEA